MALNPSNSSNLEQLALNGLIMSSWHFTRMQHFVKILSTLTNMTAINSRQQGLILNPFVVFPSSEFKQPSFPIPNCVRTPLVLCLKNYSAGHIFCFLHHYSTYKVETTGVHCTHSLQTLTEVTEHIYIGEKYNLTVAGWYQIVGLTVQCVKLWLYVK